MNRSIFAEMETIQPACCLSLQKQNVVASVCQSEEMDGIIVTDIMVIFFKVSNRIVTGG